MTKFCKPIVMGLIGEQLTEAETILYKKYKPYGFILFKRNIESKEQLLNLMGSLLFIFPEAQIFIDQEG